MLGDQAAVAMVGGWLAAQQARRAVAGQDIVANLSSITLG
jgi:hypothetical protein